MMITVDDFKARLTSEQFEELSNDVLLADGAAHVGPEQLGLIKQSLCNSYRLGEDEINLIVTGSAKLGFSLIEKKDENGEILPMFRPFDARSDIDVAILSEKLFDRIWLELSKYASNRPWLPLVHRNLGPYLVSGWLRPDQFPISSSLPLCRKWFPTFSRLSSDIRFGRRKIAAGLFYSREQLNYYQIRSLKSAFSGLGL